MNKSTFASATGILALTVTGIGLATPAAHASTHTVAGCPSGAVCIYPQNTGYNNGHPESNGIFFSYGPHNLSGQVGTHYVLNNQTGAASATLNTGYNGAGARDVIRVDTAIVTSLTPINSITLIR